MLRIIFRWVGEFEVIVLKGCVYCVCFIDMDLLPILEIQREMLISYIFKWDDILSLSAELVFELKRFGIFEDSEDIWNIISCITTNVAYICFRQMLAEFDICVPQLKCYPELYRYVLFCKECDNVLTKSAHFYILEDHCRSDGISQSKVDCDSCFSKSIVPLVESVPRDSEEFNIFLK